MDVDDDGQRARMEVKLKMFSLFVCLWQPEVSMRVAGLRKRLSTDINPGQGEGHMWHLKLSVCFR